MLSAFWMSALLGVAIGAANAGASYALYRVGREREAFLRIVLGGMVVRLVATAAVVGLVLLALPVHRAGFVVGVFAAFAVGTAVEILLIQRHAARSYS